MLKKSTPLFVSIFVLLFVGLSDYGYGCHKGGNDSKGCGGGGEEDTTSGQKSIALIMKFDDLNINNAPFDNVRSDDMGPYVHKEGAGVRAGERSQPNPAAGINLGLNARGRGGRQLLLDITCEPIEHDTDGDGTIDISIDNCDQLPPVLFDAGGEPIVYGFLKKYPECEGNNFCDLGAAVRPYKVNCPKKLLNGKCPDVFTMLPSTHLPLPDGIILDPVLISFRLGFGGGPTVEVASAIGADGSQDPGRCLSLHSDPNALAGNPLQPETILLT